MSTKTRCRSTSIINKSRATTCRDCHIHQALQMSTKTCFRSQKFLRYLAYRLIFETIRLFLESAHSNKSSSCSLSFRLSNIFAWHFGCTSTLTFLLAKVNLAALQCRNKKDKHQHSGSDIHMTAGSRQGATGSSYCGYSMSTSCEKPRAQKNTITARQPKANFECGNGLSLSY
jgi:hypothetical protein